MSASLVVTVIAPDKPGIVDLLSATVAGFGGNWESSRMASLAGRFAGLLLVDVDEARADGLALALHAVGVPGLSVLVQRGHEVAVVEDPQPEMIVEIVGNDRPGIIHALARVLAESGINVEELSTARSAAPLSGTALFSALASLRTPLGLDVAALEERLEAVAADLMVDILFHDPDGDGDLSDPPW